MISCRRTDASTSADMNVSSPPPPAQVYVSTTASDSGKAGADCLHSATIATPVNLILFSLFLIIVYMRLRPSKPTAVLPTPPPPTVFQIFTPPQLIYYNGEPDKDDKPKPVYLAVRGRVFDVSPGRNFYGPGGPYQNFAGRDASRGLACGSFDEDMLTENLSGPLDLLEDLGESEIEAMKGWEERFSEKYLVVGKLVPVGHAEAEPDA